MYMIYCPPAAPPTITFQGTVMHSGGALNCGPTLMNYDLHVAVYNGFAKSHTNFTVRIYFKNGRRWARFPLLAPQTHILVVGKVSGYTTEEHHLAILVEAVFFTAKDSMTNITSPQTPQSSPGAKRRRQDRWDRRPADSREGQLLTPSKTQQFLPSEEQDEELQVGSQLLNTANSMLPEIPLPGAETDQQVTNDTDGEADQGSAGTITPWDSTPVPDPRESSPIQRPRRARNPPKHYKGR